MLHRVIRKLKGVTFLKKASHEAGHGFVAKFVGFDVAYMEIPWQGKYGRTRYSSEVLNRLEVQIQGGVVDKHLWDAAMKRIMVAKAGLVSEKRYCDMYRIQGFDEDCSQYDQDVITVINRAVTESGGPSSEELGLNLKVEKIVSDNWNIIDRIVDAFILKWDNRLEAEHFKRLLK